MEGWAEIRRLHGVERMPVKAIARKLGVARNTVRAALAADGPARYSRPAKGSSVDAVESQVREQLPLDATMPATVIAHRRTRYQHPLVLEIPRGCSTSHQTECRCVMDVAQLGAMPRGRAIVIASGIPLGTWGRMGRPRAAMRARTISAAAAQGPFAGRSTTGCRVDYPDATTSGPAEGSTAVSITTPNRAEDTYRLLRERILYGELIPNAVLVEADIAEELRISRTPIREAFQRLAADRLIVSHRRRWYVRQYDWTDIEEVYEVRSCHEGLAARLAAGRVTDDRRTRLAAHREQVHEDRRLTDSAAWVVANDRFHSAILELAGNSRLSDIVDRTKVYYFNRHVAALYSEADRDRSSQEHLQIVDAIAAEDPDCAEAIARQHVMGAFDILRRSGGQFLA